MSTDNIDTLRTELFGTLRDLRAKKVDAETARAVVAVAQTIVNTAKAEIDHARATGATSASRFLLTANGSGRGAADDDAPALQRLPGDKPGITGVTRHRIK